jgi:hypothetical protein
MKAEREYIFFCDESDRKGLFFSNFYGGVRVGASELTAVNAALLARKQALGLTSEGPDDAAVQKSSARSAMSIVNAFGESQAPLGAACHDEGTAHRPMPLLTELEKRSVGRRFYKHGAPSGALACAGKCEISGPGSITFRFGILV